MLAPAHPAGRHERRDPHIQSEDLLPEMPGSLHAQEEVPRHRWCLLRVLLRQHPPDGLPGPHPKGSLNKIRPEGLRFQDLRPQGFEV